MSDSIDDLRRRMEAAVVRLDFEEAKRLRDQIRAGAITTAAGNIDQHGLIRQQPGAMGLGTSRQRTTPPIGWKPPPKPDPMTRGSGRTRKRAKADD